MSRISVLDIDASLHGVQASVVATSLLDQLTLSLPRLSAGNSVSLTVPGRPVRAGGTPFGTARTVSGTVLHPAVDGIAVPRTDASPASVDRPTPAGGPLHFDVVISSRTNPLSPRTQRGPAVTGQDDDAPASRSAADTLAGSHTRHPSVGGGQDSVSGAQSGDLIAPHGASPDLILTSSRDVIVRAGRLQDLRHGSGRDTLDGRSGGRHDTLMGGTDTVHGGADTVRSAAGDPQDPSGRTRPDGAAAPNDTIFGASAQEQARMALPSRTLDVTRTTHDPDGSATIHIVSGPDLASGDSRLDFDGHRHHPGSSPFDKLH